MKRELTAFVAILAVVVVIGGAFFLLPNDDSADNSGRSTRDNNSSTSDEADTNTDIETEDSDVEGETDADSDSDGTTKTYTKAELAAANGKNGNECLIALDGEVYKIEDNPLWVNGVHTTSNGRAKCGMDLSLVMKLSPHGKSVLGELEVVGKI